MWPLSLNLPTTTTPSRPEHIRVTGIMSQQQSTSAEELPHGWKKVDSKSRPGKSYFLHLKSGEKTWKLSHVHAKEREFRHKAKAKAAASSSSSKKHSSSSKSESVHALHILVKHADSRRPSSWRQESVTRKKAVAVAKVEGIREKLVACAKENPEVRDVSACMLLCVCVCVWVKETDGGVLCTVTLMDA